MAGPGLGWVLLPTLVGLNLGGPEQAARARQERARTVVLEYRQVSRVYRPATTAQPATEAAVTADNRIMIDGNRTQVEDNNPLPATGAGFTRASRIGVFDGREGRTLYPTGIGNAGRPSLILHGETTDLDVPLPVPVAAHFRGLDSAANFTPLKGLVSTGGTEVIEGTPCLEYRLRGGKGTTRYWVDPVRGFVIRRAASEGRISWRTTIDYRDDPDAGWVPSGWRFEHYREDGSVRLAHEVSVTRLVVNGPVDPAEFQLDLPATASVHDQRTGRIQLVAADGSLRDPTTEEMFGTRPPGPGWLLRNRSLVVLATTGLLTLVVGILVLRRPRPTAATTRPAAT